MATEWGSRNKQYTCSCGIVCRTVYPLTSTKSHALLYAVAREEEITVLLIGVLALIVAVIMAATGIGEELQTANSFLEKIEKHLEFVRYDGRLDMLKGDLELLRGDVSSGFVVLAAIAAQLREGEKGEPTEEGRISTARMQIFYIQNPDLIPESKSRRRRRRGGGSSDSRPDGA
jgi:hypothetical protein